MKFKMSTIAKLTIPLVSATIMGCNWSSSGGDTNGNNNGTLIPISDNQAMIYLKLDPQQVIAASADMYDGYTLHVWNDATCGSYANPDTAWDAGLPITGIDETYGAYWVLDIKDDPKQCVNFIPHKGDDKPLGDMNGKLDLKKTHKQGNYVFTKEGMATVYPEFIPTLPEKTVRVYLNQEKVNSNMKLHVWNNETCNNYAGENTDWNSGLAISGTSETYGSYWDIPLKDNSTDCINLIPHDGDEKPLGGNSTLDLTKAAALGYIAFTFEGSSTIYYQPMTKLPLATLSGAAAHWINKDQLLLKAGAVKVELLFSKNAAINFDSDTQVFSGVDKTITATRSSSNGWKASFPHLTALESWSLDLTQLDPKELLKGQLYAVAYDADNNATQVTLVQTYGALDDLYTANSGTAKTLPYGAVIDGSNTNFRVWAPTAQSVSVIKYSAAKQAQETIAMSFDAQSGAWSVSSDKLAANDFYRYQVNVYHPEAKKLVEYEVTDPYSLSLSTNSKFSQVIDLNDASLKPAGWDSLQRPVAQANPAKFVIYEAQIRDFSALDVSTSDVNKGKFGAFTETDAEPVKHLKSLKQSGVTHLHLMPFFDIATVNEDATKVADIAEPFRKLCDVNSAVASSSFSAECSSNLTIAEVLEREQQTDAADNPKVQELNRLVAAVDSFNWGYDPYHYTVPEGSYSSDPDGAKRILEMREMVMAIKNNIGMNVVMDVVYNHTNSSGPVSETSVLDKIVPWYYNRLNPTTGAVENSTCCSNTAPEHAMMAKLIEDSLVVWARDYKIDAFRFDLMGHHPLAQIKASLAAVKAVDPQTYFYGEGWNFGEVANDKLFVQATQQHLAGTGIGSFSDRLRDAVRGGGPFDSQEGLRKNQGFGNGILVQQNDLAQAIDQEELQQTALHLADITRLGMAGNLKNFKLVNATGTVTLGQDIDYNGQGAGYAQDPTEIQNYVSKHDNQTLWDNNQYKIPYAVDSATRVRMQAVSVATAMLGQGIPFTQMGSELLRSKSMQRDSYDSGDWYNKVDFTLQDNNWNKGLPRQDKDGSNYAVISKVIETSGTNAQPTPADMTDMVSFYKELANLRQAYPLITLGTGVEVNARVDFHNTGTTQRPGLIVMSIDNGAGSGLDLDPSLDSMVIVINATPYISAAENGDAFPLDNVTNLTLSELHTSKMAQGAVFADGGLTVPAWTAAVFVQKRQGDRSIGIPVTTK